MRRDWENERKTEKLYPLRYNQGFFAKFDEVAARISPTGAGGIFETGSRTNYRWLRVTIKAIAHAYNSRL